mmetsp:Transcript_8536/g.20974  ORF Transcript_8536/g.20974 Transcript_8536/m.20974 type:complete len:113 (-) Transcript_8536:262-600(-)
MQFVSDYEKEVATFFKLLVTPTTKKEQYKDSTFVQPAIIVVNNVFEIIYIYKREKGDNPLGRPMPKSLFPILLAHEKTIAQDKSIPPIETEKTSQVVTQGMASVPGVLCAIV